MWQKLRNLALPLFPAVPPRKIKRYEYVFAVLFILGATALQIVRTAVIVNPDTLWAEDGSIFLANAINQGRLASFGFPYGGYDDTLARIAGAIAATLPIRWAPAVMLTFSALTVALCALIVWYALVVHLPSYAGRGLVVGLILLLPIASFEMIGNVANAQWYLIFAAFCILLWRPQSIFPIAISGTVCFLAAVTDPLVIFFVPLACVRLFALPKLRENIVTAGLFLGSALQLFAVTHTQTAKINSMLTPAYFAGLYVARVSAAVFSGNHINRSFFSRGQYTFGIAVTLVLAVVIVFAMVQRRWQLVSVLVVMQLVLFAVPIRVRWDAPTLTTTNFLSAGRYITVPFLMLWLVIALVVFGSKKKRWIPIQVAVFAIAVFICVVDFRGVTARTSAPTWDQSLARAQQQCLHANGNAIVALPITPAQWVVELPCWASLQ